MVWFHGSQRCATILASIQTVKGTFRNLRTCPQILFDRGGLFVHAVGLLTHTSWSHISLLASLSSSLWVKWLFVLPQWCLSLVSPPLAPSAFLPGNKKDIFGDVSFLFCSDPTRIVVILVSFFVSGNKLAAVVQNPPFLSLSPLVQKCILVGLLSQLYFIKCWIFNH